MNLTPAQRRTALTAIVILSTVPAIAITLTLRTYEVPGLLALCAGLAVGATGIDLLIRSWEAATTRMYRCTRLDCDFEVRLGRPGPGDAEWAQTLAAAHPGHQPS